MYSFYIDDVRTPRNHAYDPTRPVRGKALCSLNIRQEVGWAPVPSSRRGEEKSIYHIGTRTSASCLRRG
jgi:hypothetical protein